MAIIAVQFENIEGECTQSGCENHVEAVGLRESIEAGVGAMGRGGRGRQSDFEVIRFRDSASPKLAQACSSAENLGQVTIRVFQTNETGPGIYLVYELKEVYVSRVEQSTLDEGNEGFRPHLMSVNRGLPVPGAIGLPSTLAPVISAASATSRLVPIPQKGNGAFTNRELERIFLNANSVKWSYTPYVGGAPAGVVERGFNLRAGTLI